MSTGDCPRPDTPGCKWLVRADVAAVVVFLLAARVSCSMPRQIVAHFSKSLKSWQNKNPPRAHAARRRHTTRHIHGRPTSQFVPYIHSMHLSCLPAKPWNGVRCYSGQRRQGHRERHGYWRREPMSLPQARLRCSSPLVSGAMSWSYQTRAERQKEVAQPLFGCYSVLFFVCMLLRSVSFLFVNVHPAYTAAGRRAYPA